MQIVPASHRIDLATQLSPEGSQSLTSNEAHCYPEAQVTAAGPNKRCPLIAIERSTTAPRGGIRKVPKHKLANALSRQPLVTG